MPLELDEFVSESRRVGKTRRCQVHAVLAALSAKDRKALESALAADPLDISPGAIANVLKRKGHAEITANAVSSHRRQSCSCFKAKLS